MKICPECGDSNRDDAKQCVCGRPFGFELPPGLRRDARWSDAAGISGPVTENSQTVFGAQSHPTPDIIQQTAYQPPAVIIYQPPPLAKREKSSVWIIIAVLSPIAIFALIWLFSPPSHDWEPAIGNFRRGVKIYEGDYGNLMYFGTVEDFEYNHREYINEPSLNGSYAGGYEKTYDAVQIFFPDGNSRWFDMQDFYGNYWVDLKEPDDGTVIPANLTGMTSNPVDSHPYAGEHRPESENSIPHGFSSVGMRHAGNGRGVSDIGYGGVVRRQPPIPARPANGTAGVPVLPVYTGGQPPMQTRQQYGGGIGIGPEVRGGLTGSVLRAR